MRYYLEFKKTGDIKYTSHLDMQRLFKRAFKRAGIPIEYSQGFNPHPKMGFAQPLSLGYTASSEYLEFNTTKNIRSEFALDSMRNNMPEGIEITKLEEFNSTAKSMASDVTGAIYEVLLPISYRHRHSDVQEIVDKYLAQETIIAKKREKKTKKWVDKDIKPQIHWIKVHSSDDGYIVLLMELDGGSSSNLSPEQVITSFTEFSGLYLPREEIEVNRKKIIFKSISL